MRIALVGAGQVDRHAPSKELARRFRRAGAVVDLHPHHRVGRLGRGRLDVDVVVPAVRGDVPLAVAAAGGRAVVHAPPQWDVPRSVDHAWAAPGDLVLSSSPRAAGGSRHTVAATDATTPDPRRHDGVRIAVVARWTAATPARYLVDGLRDAGVEVQQLTGLDHRQLAAGTIGVVVVESPLPAFPVTGTARCPVVLWAHHGEHHTGVHTRLVARYGADAVLLAHSWHLAVHQPVPVHRFPFSLPAALARPHVPWAARRHDVAFVGSGTAGGGAYGRRGQILDALVAAVGADRTFVEEGVPPAVLADSYADARIVPNDCGTRHRPITMRVFEAINAGALLLTEDAPGTDRLFMPGTHHVLLDRDVTTQCRRLLADAETATLARAATDHARRHHTTRHRVDQLVDLLDRTTSAGTRPVETPSDPLLRPVAEDLLLDDVLPLGLDDPAAVEALLPDRTVWEPERLDRLADRPLAHAVLVGRHYDGPSDAPARAARRVVVADPVQRDVLAAVLARHPAAVVREGDRDAVVVDLGTPGYRVQPVVDR